MEKGIVKMRKTIGLILSMFLALQALPALAGSTQPGLSEEAPLQVKYYLTAREMGATDEEIAQYIRAMVRDYDLKDGVYYLTSCLDTAYPDERAKVTIADGEIVVEGPYLPVVYRISVR